MGDMLPFPGLVLLVRDILESHSFLRYPTPGSGLTPPCIAPSSLWHLNSFPIVLIHNDPLNDLYES